VARADSQSGVTEGRSKGRRGSGVFGSLVEVVVIVAAAFVLALLIQQFIVKPFYIPSESMENTLVKGDRVLVSRFTYRFGQPHRGDIVVFHPPSDQTQDYIKRVVGVAGDTVAVRDGRLYINGVVQDEPYVKEPRMVVDFDQKTVPQGSIFVMGDNRNNSGDSRVFGPVKVNEVVGEAFLVYWPLTKLHWL
jgi:signal peptidase I